MKIESWRLVPAEWVHAAFTGEGGLTHSSRWNKKGTRIVYTASSLSLATLELIANAPPSLIATKRYFAIPVVFDETIVQRINTEELLPNWSQYPATNATKELGTAWIDSAQSAVLAVPSALVPTELNFLLNPTHPEFCNISLGKPNPHKVAKRLLERLK
jgi:RES domain-containing protein